MRRLYDGYWFPSIIRDVLITPDRSFETMDFQGGAPLLGVETAASAAQSDCYIRVRWPCLELDDWQRSIAILQASRRCLPMGDWYGRVPSAVRRSRAIWAEQSRLLSESVLKASEICTGYSTEMLRVVLGLLDLVSIEELQRSASFQLGHSVKEEFVALKGLPGRVQFLTGGRRPGPAVWALGAIKRFWKRPWHINRQMPDVIVCYAADGTPCMGFLLVLLGLVATIRRRGRPPLILVHNSRREPLFTPLMLTALELIDPLLPSTTMVTLWDRSDTALQEYLISQADLVIASADDQILEELGDLVGRVSTQTRPIRFHQHRPGGGLVTVGRECFGDGRIESQTGRPWLDMVALLVSVDVAFWRQQNHRSVSVHFVERDSGSDRRLPEAYGKAVVQNLRSRSAWACAAGAWRSPVADLREYETVFAGGEALEEIVIPASTGQGEAMVQVLSQQGDEFLVILERRSVTGCQLQRIIDSCQQWIVVVVPVDDVMEVPQRYLDGMRRETVRSMSVALGEPGGEGLDPRLLRYAEALATAGVTRIHTVGRGMLPSLSHSWDGLLPLDLSADRPEGYFVTVDFDEPWTQIDETHQLVREALKLGK